mmetsp:Transcript_73090/g.128783  ORF Transcript_73090/g.128783 Transcript_73090/m.128783 type:complete len:207 (+) Transcript_73090:129-749(+)
MSHCVCMHMPINCTCARVRVSVHTTHGSDLPVWTVAKAAATCATLPQRADVGSARHVLAGQSLTSRNRRSRVQCLVSGLNSEMVGSRSPICDRLWAGPFPLVKRLGQSYGQGCQKQKKEPTVLPDALRLSPSAGCHSAAADAPAAHAFSSGLLERWRLSIGRGCMLALTLPPGARAAQAGPYSTLGPGVAAPQAPFGPHSLETLQG